MADMMMFPKTVDEFMEKYKIIDSDEVYTNGVELVPIFRMKQWFEHANASPVKHGQWLISLTGWLYCSECKGEPPCESNVGTDYCPNCGAKMDEVEDE